MVIATDNGFDYSCSDFEGRARAIGFQKVEFIKLSGSSSAAIAYK
jgi:hypothetical protein